MLPFFLIYCVVKISAAVLRTKNAESQNMTFLRTFYSLMYPGDKSMVPFAKWRYDTFDKTCKLR